MTAKIRIVLLACIGLLPACNTPPAPTTQNARELWDRLHADQDGTREAERDIAAGRLVIRRFGRPWGAALLAKAMLKNRFGIELEFTGSILAGDRLYHDHSYNQRMEREIEKRFGAGIVDAVCEEAERLQATWDRLLAPRSSITPR